MRADQITPATVRLDGPIRAGEVYTCVLPDGSEYLWDVTLANRLARLHLSPELIVLDEPAREALLALRTEWDAARLDAADPLVPALVVCLDGLSYVIDGNHRVRRAIRDDWEAVPIFALTTQLELRCRVMRWPAETDDRTKALALVEWQRAGNHLVHPSERPSAVGAWGRAV